MAHQILESTLSREIICCYLVLVAMKEKLIASVNTFCSCSIVFWPKPWNLNICYYHWSSWISFHCPITTCCNKLSNALFWSACLCRDAQTRFFPHPILKPWGIGWYQALIWHKILIGAQANMQKLQVQIWSTEVKYDSAQKRRHIKEVEKFLIL